jgi:hypothetical protein
MHFTDRLARAACVIGLAVGLVGCTYAPDAGVPPGYEPLVESARASVLDNYEGLVRPHLAVTRVRCFADGGLVILFRQVGGRTPGEPAFAMGGGEQLAPDMYAWSGGYGATADIEEEIAFNYGNVPEVACGLRAP